ncbi:MAG: hypothetical protein Phog2KO_20840 [Phototrophicaceae bacterium]
MSNTPYRSYIEDLGCNEIQYSKELQKSIKGTGYTFGAALATGPASIALIWLFQWGINANGLSGILAIILSSSFSILGIIAFITFFLTIFGMTIESFLTILKKIFLCNFIAFALKQRISKDSVTEDELGKEKDSDNRKQDNEVSNLADQQKKSDIFNHYMASNGAQRSQSKGDS